MDIDRPPAGGITSSQRPPPKDQRAPPREEAERKQRVLTHGTPSITSTIADAVVLKDGDLFLLPEADGRIPDDRQHSADGFNRRLLITRPLLPDGSDRLEWRVESET